MALLSNVPTLSYIRWQNLLITYQGTTYQISNNQTNKAYIYWDVGNPTELIASSRKLEEKSGQFYIFFNEKGKYTVVPNDEIEINFSEGGAREAITDTIIGFGQKIDANTQKFSTIEADIDTLKTTIGEIKENGSGGTSSTVSKIEQRVDKIDLEVKGVEKKYSDDTQLIKMREDFNEVLLSLQATLGLFSSDMNTYMGDNSLSPDEKNNIISYKTSLEQKRVELNNQLNTVVEYLNGIEDIDQARIIEINASKDGLNTAISNLFTNIDVACSDNIFTNTEITTIVSYFGKTNLAINECKNTIDYVFLGVGGFLIEEVSNITLEQDNIKLEVKKVENHIDTEISKIELEQNNIKLEVKKVEDNINTEISKIELEQDNIKLEVKKVEDNINTEISKIELEQDNIKLEVKDYIDTEISNIILDQDSIKLEVKKVVEDYIDTEISKIELEQDNIKLEVKRIGDDYVTSSEMTQTSDNIKMSFLQGGGINKFHNSSFKNGTKYWSALSWNSNGGSGGEHGLYVAEPPADWCLSNRNALCAAANNLNNYTGNALGVGFDSENISGGTEWTLECLLACHRATDITIEILEHDNNGTRLSPHQTKTVTAKWGGRDRRNWTKVNFQFTLQHSNCAYFICRFFMGAWTGESVDAYMWIGEPILVPGHHSELLYSPNADEVYEGITKIDKDGIKVSNSNASTTTSMTADGFYINQTGDGDIFKVDSNGISLSQGIVNLSKNGLTINSYNGIKTITNSSGFYINQSGYGDIFRVDTNGVSLSQGIVGLSKYGLTINSPNYNVATYIDANGLNVVQNGSSAIKVHDNGLEIAQGLVNINSQHMRISHADGTYSEMNADGIVHYQNGTGRKYHYLVYGGEYTCYSEETATITLPDEFKGKDFSIITVVKRIYAHNNTDITGAKYPLLSFYAESLNKNTSNGTFQIYASIRAWNRTGTSGLGTMIGDGSYGTTESNLLKPVVAYWVFV